MEEHCEIRGGEVIVSRGVDMGANIRRRGEDVPQGCILVAKGTLIDARHIAILAAAGVTEVRVKRKLRVSILSTGDEIQDGGLPLDFGKIYDSNRPMLAALLAEPFIELRDCGSHGDSPRDLAQVFSRAAEISDVIISSGAAAGSDTDHVLEAIQIAGGKAESCHLALKPGKPMIVGSLRAAAILGLPGNPVAAFVNFLLFARALIAAKAGAEAKMLRLESAIVEEKMSHSRGRREFVPVDIVSIDASGRCGVAKIGRGGSASLRPLVMAKGFADLPADRHDIESGEAIGFFRFSHTSM
jgi:molybdopterin molybdotransferase